MRSASSVKVFLSFACILAAGSAYRSYSTLASPQPDAYGLERARTRMLPLAGRLPSSGIIGYLSDMPTSEHVGGMALHAVQYVLAPRAVVDIRFDPTPDWAIGNFSRPLDFRKLGEQHGLRIVRDFGEGVVLYRRERP
jgi:hypothetical protein